MSRDPSFSGNNDTGFWFWSERGGCVCVCVDNPVQTFPFGLQENMSRIKKSRS